MPRPRKTVRPRSLHLKLPEDILDRIDLLLFSPLEGRVPQGAYQSYFLSLIQRDFASRAPTDQEAHNAQI